MEGVDSEGCVEGAGGHFGCGMGCEGGCLGDGMCGESDQFFLSNSKPV